MRTNAPECTISSYENKTKFLRRGTTPLQTHPLLYMGRELPPQIPPLAAFGYSTGHPTFHNTDTPK